MHRHLNKENRACIATLLRKDYQLLVPVTYYCLKINVNPCVN